MRKNIRRVFWLYVVLFALAVGYLVRFIVTQGSNISINPYNPRLAMTDQNIIRGSIYDRSGEILAETGGIPGGYGRIYPEGENFAHTVGYVGMGFSGIEAKYNFALNSPRYGILDRVIGVIQGRQVSGQNLTLTLDVGLQDLICKNWGSCKGAAVVLEPSTGRVLAMTSYPSFDPASVAANWSALQSDTDNNSLMNRASQGLYPPGSVFKILTTIAALENGFSDFTYTCTGETTIGNDTIRCFNSDAHGDVDLAKAVAVSCNTYFANLLTAMGPDGLTAVCGRAGFNTPLNFTLPASVSGYALNSDSSGFEIMQTAIGQGKTLVTPLEMAMIAAAVANGGVMKEPYLLDSYVGADGKPYNITAPKTIAQLCTADEAQTVTGFMEGVVKSGTGTALQIDGLVVAAKTGTAENAAGDPHGWLIAFAPADDPQVALAIVLENSNGPHDAMPLAKKIIEYVCDR